MRVKAPVRGMVYAFDLDPSTPEDPIVVVTKTCLWCGEKSEVHVLQSKLDRWTSRSELIQDIWPDVQPEMREVLITGYHSICFDQIFREEEG